MAGRTPKPIDLTLVERAAALGLTAEEIGELLGVSRWTIERRAAAALQRGRAKLSLRLRRMQWQVAKRGSATMLIWLGKQYLGQTDKQDIWTDGGQLVVVEKIATASERRAD
ncbi:MAG: hypothetical protein ACPL7K_09150 [Armatimonadota bacterium]